MRLQSFHIHNTTIELYVPEDNRVAAPGQHSPYWARVWPAALGLCCFLKNNIGYIQNKKVLELAAGLGLPSIFAAGFAKQVVASDIEPAALSYIRKSAIHHQLHNLHTTIIDWNQPLETGLYEVVLLSDVNYEPASFPALQTVILSFLNTGCSVILSTPQRLMAKEFVNQLLDFSIHQKEIFTDTGVAVSVFVLQKK